jgi:hypothetical protein
MDSMRMKGILGLRSLIQVGIGLLAASVSHAVDGVIEINQASVLANGGFPVTLSEAGSYHLTSNLDVTAGSGAARDTAALRTSPTARSPRRSRPSPRSRPTRGARSVAISAGDGRRC